MPNAKYVGFQCTEILKHEVVYQTFGQRAQVLQKPKQIIVQNGYLSLW